MDLKALRYFLAVAREENMTRAAENLHVSQPTLSKQLKALEDELAKKLFIRHAFSIELTEEGYLLKKRAEDLVAMADKIIGEFASLDDITGGEIYLGLAESYQISDLAKVIHQLKQNYPNLHYHIISGDSEQVLQRLDQGYLDFATIVETPDYSKYESLEFPRRDIWGAIISNKHPLAQKTVIQVEDLIGQPLFCSKQSWQNDIPRWAGKQMSQLQLEGSFKLAYNAAVFVKENLGIYLTFDKLITANEESELVFRPLTPRLESKMYLIWKKNQLFSPMAEKLLNYLKEFFQHADVKHQSIEKHSH